MHLCMGPEGSPRFFFRKYIPVQICNEISSILMTSGVQKWGDRSGTEFTALAVYVPQPLY